MGKHHRSACWQPPIRGSGCSPASQAGGGEAQREVCWSTALLSLRDGAGRPLRASSPIPVLGHLGSVRSLCPDFGAVALPPWGPCSSPHQAEFSRLLVCNKTPRLLLRMLPASSSGLWAQRAEMGAAGAAAAPAASSPRDGQCQRPRPWPCHGESMQIQLSEQGCVESQLKEVPGLGGWRGRDGPVHGGGNAEDAQGTGPGWIRPLPGAPGSGQPT